MNERKKYERNAKEKKRKKKKSSILDRNM